MNDNPIFVVGVHRSGTTLLRYMLSSSPRIYIPPESDFIPRFFLNRPERALDSNEVDKLLQRIFDEYRFVKEWQAERPEARAFRQIMSTPTPAAFLDTLYRQYAAQYGAVRWGDKTPIYTSYVELIARILPRAQFVHIIRDVRDVTLSMLDKWGAKEMHVDVFFAARTWVRRIRSARTAGRKLGPGLYYELKYENLVEEPERELRALCDFLDEPFGPEMLAPHRIASKQLPAGGFHEAVRHPPSRARTGRWRSEMTPADLRLVQAVAAEMMSATGYAVEEAGRMLATEQLRYWGLAAKYTTLQAGRNVLQRAGLVPPI